MTAPSAPPPAGFLTIADAADQLGAKPWDVVRLIESGQLATVTLIPVTALPNTREIK